MARPSLRRLQSAAGPILFACVLVALLVPLSASSWQGDDAAEATAGRLDDHEAHSENPNDSVVGSEDPNSMTVESETMAGREAQSENPDSMEASAGQLDDHEVDSESLADLAVASPDHGYESIEVSGQSSWELTNDPAVQAARDNLVKAQERASAARTTYGDMMERNYPRGQARLDIVKERDTSMQALEKAKAALEATGN
jgi:hypothetical protein